MNGRQGDRFMNNASAPAGEGEADAQCSAVLHCLQELKNSAVVIYSKGRFVVVWFSAVLSTNLHLLLSKEVKL